MCFFAVHNAIDTHVHTALHTYMKCVLLSLCVYIHSRLYSLNLSLCILSLFHVKLDKSIQVVSDTLQGIQQTCGPIRLVDFMYCFSLHTLE